MEFETLEGPTPEQIWEALRAQVRPGRRRALAVEEAVGHVLAADARAAQDFPALDRAAAGGYAVRVADFAAGKARLRCVEGECDGGGRGAPLEPGTCVRIEAGDSLPPGADAVVPSEGVQSVGVGLLEFGAAPDPGQHIERQASLISKDGLLLRAGTRIQAGALATFAAAATRQVEVFARPRVAQLSADREPVPPGETPLPGTIPDANSVAVEELIRHSGGETVMFGRCPEERVALRASLELGLANELLCIIGAESSRGHDMLEPLLGELGVRWLVRGARLQPGRTLRIGRAGTGCWVLGLPGDPVGCAVCFLLFGRPLLGGLQGLPPARPPHLAGRLDTDLPANDGLPLYQPGEWSAGPDGQPRVAPLAWCGAGDPRGLATANALLYRAESAGAALRDEQVPFIPLDLPR